MREGVSLRAPLLFGLLQDSRRIAGPKAEEIQPTFRTLDQGTRDGRAEVLLQGDLQTSRSEESRAEACRVMRVGPFMDAPRTGLDLDRDRLSFATVTPGKHRSDFGAWSPPHCLDLILFPLEPKTQIAEQCALMVHRLLGPCECAQASKKRPSRDLKAVGQGEGRAHMGTENPCEGPVLVVPHRERNVVLRRAIHFGIGTAEDSSKVDDGTGCGTAMSFAFLLHALVNRQTLVLRQVGIEERCKKTRGRFDIKRGCGKQRLASGHRGLGRWVPV